jgi:NhaP-type Na+/H+ or K+/H+ antiporter
LETGVRPGVVAAMDQGVAVAVLCIGLGGMTAQWLAWRYKLPAIVLLFVAGLLFGPGLGLIHPSATLGRFMQPAIGLAVAIVVFEGGLALEFSELRAAGGGVLRLTAVALPINWVLAAAAAHLVGGLGWGPAILFGSITVVTGPTVVLPLLRHTRLQRRAASFLKWEAIVNDPVGAVLATLVLQVLIAGHANQAMLAGEIAGRVALALVVSAALGIGAAYGIRIAFARDHVAERLKTPILLVGAMTVYALANLVMEGAGLAAATLMGVALANLRVHGLSELRRFKESLVVLIVSALFIMLTADLQRRTLAELSWPMVWLTLAVLFVVRPAGIWLATIGSGLTLAERTLAGWVAPRGIVAAAVAGAAGLRLAGAGYAGAHLIMPDVFVLIAATMILHGFTLGPVARRLGLTLSDRPGLAILGASAWSTDMACALNGAGVPALLIDSFPGALDEARARNLPVLQAEILSAHGGEELDGRPVDYFIAATPDDIYNGLVCARLAPELGRERVLQISPGARNLDADRGFARDARGKVLGNAAWDYAMFEEFFAKGWRFRVADGESVADEIALITLRAGGALVMHSVEDPVDAAPASGDKTLVFGAGVRTMSDAAQGEVDALQE